MQCERLMVDKSLQKCQRHKSLRPCLAPVDSHQVSLRPRQAARNLSGLREESVQVRVVQQGLLGVICKATSV